MLSIAIDGSLEGGRVVADEGATEVDVTQHACRRVIGVDVVPFVDAELNGQFPGRELQKAQTPKGFRDG